MKHTEALTKLLLEYGKQEQHPELWQDNPWKGTYYLLFNKVFNALERLDIEELAK